MAVITDYAVSAYNTYGPKVKIVKKVGWDAPLKAIEWSNWATGKASVPKYVCQTTLEHTRHFFFLKEYPTKLGKMCRAVQALQEIPSLGDGGAQVIKIYILACSALGDFAGKVGVFHDEKVFILSERSLKVLSQIGLVASAAEFLSSTQGARKHFGKLNRAEPGSVEYNMALAKLMKKLGLMALSSMEIAVSLSGGEVAAQWVKLSLSTTLLAISIFTYFYNEFYVEPKALH